MAKFKERIKARELRKKGKGIRDIAKKLKVSKGSVSIWCRDIELTQKQIDLLSEKEETKRYEGRIKGARVQHEKRKKEVLELRKIGSEIVNPLSKRDLLLFGFGFYLGDGSKGRRVKMSNSNPEAIKLSLSWLNFAWNIPKEEITLHVSINEQHCDRIEEVEQYWSKLTKIPRSQFTKTTLVKAKNKKVYKNFNEHYGTMTVIVRKSGDMLHKIMGATSKVCNTTRFK